MIRQLYRVATEIKELSLQLCLKRSRLNMKKCHCLVPKQERRRKEAERTADIPCDVFNREANLEMQRQKLARNIDNFSCRSLALHVISKGY